MGWNSAPAGAAAITLAGIAALAGCGSSHGASSAASHRSGWGTLRLSSGAALPYPISWRRVSGDLGSASAALFNADGTIRAYLNVTPAIPKETLGGWARFRVAHNADEGDRHVRLLSAQTNVAFDGGRRSCVMDQYQTSRTSYRELACIVTASGGGRRNVIVAAAQPAAWSQEGPALRFAIDHFTS